MAQIPANLLDDIVDAAIEFNPGDNMSPVALREIASQLSACDLRRSAETGAGGSTLLFSQMGAHHTAFAVEGETNLLTRLRSSVFLRQKTTEFVEGPTQVTLPRYCFDQPLQAALIDGPHAFPFPQMEYFYFYPQIAAGGLLVIDDIHIRTIHELYRFLCRDEMFQLTKVVDRTAFFRRTTAPVFDPLGDGWWRQAYNRKLLFRYTWREVLAESLPKPIRASIRRLRALGRTGFVPTLRNPLSIETPKPGSTANATITVRGRAQVPVGKYLWMFARRADLSGWWPQGDGPVSVAGDEWQQECKLGEERDQGEQFDIAAIIVTKEHHEKILRWFLENSRSGCWGPMRLPEPLVGTGVARVRVTRERLIHT